MDGYRKIEPLAGVKIIGNDPGPAPEILYLDPAAQLVVSEEYQRGVSIAGKKLIRSMAEWFDWESFKAPNVARTEDPNVFEVTDGQHTAIAAAMNGNIPFLPCLCGRADTTAAKARGFLGINQRRIPLSLAAIYTAEVAAEDPVAMAVALAIGATGVKVLSSPPSRGKFLVGDTMAVRTLQVIAKERGAARLEGLLRIAVQAQAAPVSACLVKALDTAIPLDADDSTLNRVMVVLRGQGAGRLEIIAKSRTAAGRRSFETLADIVSDFAKLDRRLGRPKAEPKAPGRKPMRAAA